MVFFLYPKLSTEESKTIFVGPGVICVANVNVAIDMIIDIVYISVI